MHLHLQGLQELCKEMTVNPEYIAQPQNTVMMNTMTGPTKYT